MFKKEPSQRLQQRRPASGQAIVEGTVMTGAMLLIFVVLAFVLVQSYVAANENYCLLNVASSAAKRIVDSKWWLGMEDPRYVPPVQGTNSNDQTTRIARQELDASLRALGFGRSRNFKVTLKKIWLQKKETTLVKVEFDVDSKLPVLRTTLKLHPVGIASDAEHAITAHGYSLLHVVSPDGAQQRGLRIPVYNVTIGNDTNADTSSPPDSKWFRAGNVVNPVPTAYLRLKCSTLGSQLSRPIISRDTGLVEYNEVRPWGPWDGVQPHNEAPSPLQNP